MRLKFLYKALKMISIYTDGAAPSNGKEANAGYGYMIPKLNIIDGGFLIGTNNVAELTAIQKALTIIYQLHNRITEREIEIVTDSEYCVLVLSTDAKLKANVNLILRIKDFIAHLEEIGFNISFRHVKSHGKVDETRSEEDKLCNDTVDNIAVKMAKNKGNYTVRIIDQRFGFDFAQSSLSRGDSKK